MKIKHVHAYGYPSQINGADARYRMCKSSGYIRSQTSKYLKGDWDLTGGFSGGPLVEYISGAGYVAIGIHKDGSTIDGSSYPTSYTGACPAPVGSRLHFLRCRCQGRGILFGCPCVQKENGQGLCPKRRPGQDNFLSANPADKGR